MTRRNINYTWWNFRDWAKVTTMHFKVCVRKVQCACLYRYTSQNCSLAYTVSLAMVAYFAVTCPHYAYERARLRH